jgi:hypothetical protein
MVMATLNSKFAVACAILYHTSFVGGGRENRQVPSDLYGLGATLICLLANLKSTQVGELIDDNYRFKLDRLSALNPKFVRWLEKMVEPQASNRYANAAIALAELEKSRSRQSSCSPKVLAAITVVLGIAIIAIFKLVSSSWTGESSYLDEQPYAEGELSPSQDPAPPTNRPIGCQVIKPSSSGGITSSCTDEEQKFLQNLRFKALYFVGQEPPAEVVSYGTFTAQGAILNSLKPLIYPIPYKINHLVYVPRWREFYGISNHYFYKKNRAADQVFSEQDQISLDRNISWLTGLDYDEKRDRLLLSCHDGIYSYPLSTKRWERLTTRDIDLVTLTYSKEEDAIYTLGQSYGDGKIFINKFNASGALIVKKRIFLPENTSFGDAAFQRTQMFSQGKYLVLLVSSPSDKSGNIYVIDPETKRIITPQ